MVRKHPPSPKTIRTVPKQFSWVDHRLVRDRHLDRCSHGAAALYLFVVTVADAQGLSYYSDQSISQRLTMDEQTLQNSRRELIKLGLIAYKRPVYQVLPLDMPSDVHRSPGQLESVKEVFKRIGENLS